MTRSLSLISVIFLALLAGLGIASLFTVHQTKQALVLQFGDPRRVVTEAGLHFKMPFVQNVIYIDKRILDLDSPAEELIAADQKRLVVDACHSSHHSHRIRHGLDRAGHALGGIRTTFESRCECHRSYAARRLHLWRCGL